MYPIKYIIQLSSFLCVKTTSILYYMREYCKARPPLWTRPWPPGKQEVCRSRGAGGGSSPPVLASWPPRYKPPGARRSCSLASRAGQPPYSCLLAPSSLHLAPASSQSPPGHLMTSPDVKVSTSLPSPDTSHVWRRIGWREYQTSLQYSAWRPVCKKGNQSLSWCRSFLYTVDIK